MAIRLALARLALLWERVWPALWPAVGVAGAFFVIALFDVLPALPGLLHAAVLAAFAAGFLWTLVRGLREIRLPTDLEAKRRLERDSGFDHRPLTGLEDQLVSGAGRPEVLALWEAHKRRMLAQLSGMRSRLPHPGLAARDPYALRGVLLLGLLIALGTGFGEWRDRLSGALQPSFAEAAVGPPPSLDLWITPPQYTGLAPVLLTGTGSDASAEHESGTQVRVPVGSTLLGQVTGGSGLPVLRLDHVEASFAQITAQAYKIEQTIEAGSPPRLPSEAPTTEESDSGAGLRLVVEQNGQPLGNWMLELIPDEAPTVAFSAPPGETARNTLRLEYEAADDYGLATLAASIQRIDEPGIAPIELSLALPGRNLQDARGQSFHDLTPHPWAGIAVEVTLIASDALGQFGRSDAVRTVLPERIFVHPVARALAELRKQLTLDPTARFPVVRALRELYANPDHFFNDVVVALALTMAQSRLIHDQEDEAIPEVQQLMWDTALRIEEGDLAIAERDLRELQEKLLQALAEGKEQSEIDRLMDELQAALDQFLEALSEQMMEQMAQGAEPQPMPPNAQFMDSQDLREMLERARELARSGAREAARDMLAQLQEMLQNLRANPFQQMDQNQQNAWQMMDDLEGIMQRQQELLDRSYQRAQRGERGEQGQPQQGQQGQGQPGGEAGNRGERGQQGQGQRGQAQQGQGRGGRMDAMTQEQLRRQLGELMRRLGEAMGDIPRPLGRAERAMRDARDALGGGQSADAIDPQTRALDQLQQGMQAMAQRFMEMMAETPGQGQGPVGMEPGPGQDPLGRGMGDTGFEAMEGVRIPSEAEVQRARQILQELRRRRGERQRPQGELDYIDRLLERF